MQITLKLFASLTDFLPAGSTQNIALIGIDDGDSVADIIDRFNLPERLVHLVLVDGVFIPPGDRAGRALVDGETLAIWPPVAGG